MDAFVIAATSRQLPIKHPFKNDRTVLHSATVGADFCANVARRRSAKAVVAATAAATPSARLIGCAASDPLTVDVIIKSTVHCLLIVERHHCIRVSVRGHQSAWKKNKSARFFPVPWYGPRMAKCEPRWEDVFVTSPRHENGHEEFVAPIVSVYVRRGRPTYTTSNTHITAAHTTAKLGARTANADTLTAYVKAHDNSGDPVGGSEWLMCGFPFSLNAAMSAKLLDIKVGDRIRVGDLATSGYSDYMTVLEVGDALSLHNMNDDRAHELRCGTGFVANSVTNPSNGVLTNGPTQLVAQTTSTDAAGSSWVYMDQFLPGAARLFRVNRTLNAYDVPSYVASEDTELLAYTGGARHNSVTSARAAPLSEYTGQENRYFPLYVHRPWTDNHVRTLSVPLPSPAKMLHAVKLVGYSIVHAESVGYHTQHESHPHDWYALHIKEVDGAVISNDPAAHGAFYVINGGNNSDRFAGAIELYEHDPHGLICRHTTPGHKSRLTIELRDSLGQVAAFGRTHIWLRVLMT